MGRKVFSTFAVWGGYFTAGEIPPLLTKDCLMDIENCFQEQIHSCGKSEIVFFATVNDYDYMENHNQANIQTVVSVSEQIASISYKYDGSVYRPQVTVIGFDSGSTDRKILPRILPEDFNRDYEDFNAKLQIAIQNSEILSENANDYTTIPAIVGGKAAFISDGLHYDGVTLLTIIEYLRKRFLKKNAFGSSYYSLIKRRQQRRRVL